ncbi:MAG: hypothetical protein HUJ76_11650, partial [Parasporobacterium sp.]|nr:hypothetical protein [Parasporobacterium sp.]
MNITYRTGINGSFMVMSGIYSESIDEFSMKMLSVNRIPGLISVSREEVNGEGSLIYDISSRQSFGKTLEMNKLSRKELKVLVEALKDCSDRVEGYLLEPDRLILEPDMIYTDPERKKYRFCFDPASSGRMKDDLKKLFDRIINYIDYSDPVLVRMAYEMSIAVQKEGFSLKDLSECIRKNETEEELSVRKIKCIPENGFPGEDAVNELREEAAAYAGHLHDTYEPESFDADTGFFDKLKNYLRDRNLKEIVADIDDGVFIREVKRSKGRIEFSKSRK